MSRLPTLTARQVLQALKRAGFVPENQRGSHLIVRHPATDRLTTIPIHPGDVPRYLVRQILQQAGLTEKEFRSLL